MGADRREERHAGHRRLRDEDRAPAEALREDPAEHRAERGAECSRHRPDGHAASPRAEQHPENRQRAGEEERSAETLDATGPDQEPEIVGDGARDRCGDEEEQAGTEDEVGSEAMHAEDEDERGDRHDDVVRGDHPGDALDRGVELHVELGQCEDDDRRVGERHRHGAGDRRHEQEPPGASQARRLLRGGLLRERLRLGHPG